MNGKWWRGRRGRKKVEPDKTPDISGDVPSTPLSPSGTRCPVMRPPAQTPGCGPAFTASSREGHLHSGARGKMTGSPVIISLWPPKIPWESSPDSHGDGPERIWEGVRTRLRGGACCSLLFVSLCTLRAPWWNWLLRPLLGTALQSLVCRSWRRREPWVRHFKGFLEFAPLEKLSKESGKDTKWGVRD